MENLPHPVSKSRDLAAATVGVSGKLVSDAKAIKEEVGALAGMTQDITVRDLSVSGYAMVT